uniref:GST C-terminal domain-containing protein n=1 Tax=Rhizochromulina marina TaxID=1034831 RepID=A0A6U0ZYK3_9STRA|mmetsp:Transcript_23318/g.68071  ORF Transcript_23318/g.68071 Transcript_23318/m.68071 type:complete len:183 (+) Transcript_23318:505-1053(+)
MSSSLGPSFSILPTSMTRRASSWKEPAARAQVISWVMWQMGSGPYLGGGFGHFYNYAPVKIEYAVNRFTFETKRQFDVLNNQLKDGRPYLCGDEYTLADIMIWPWYGILALGKMYGDAKTFLDIEESYPHVMKWAHRIAAREPVVRGKKVNKTWGPKEGQLRERHARSDFDTRTEDKLNPDP